MQETVSVKRSRPNIFWIAGYGLMLTLSLIILYSTIDSAPVIWGTEAEIGRSLTCEEAYARRDISGALYDQHRTPSDILYLFSLLFPAWAFLFGAVTLAVVRRTRGGVRWFVIGLSLAVTAAIVIHLPVIRLIACATE